MPIGLEVSNPDGSLLWGTGQRLGRFLGYHDIPQSSSGGSMTDYRLEQAGTPFFFTYAAMYDGGVDITFSGPNMSWTRRRYKNGQLDIYWSGRIYYGLF